MKKTLLLLTVCTLLFSLKTIAQNVPYTLTVFDQAIYYGMYEATVSEPLPAGAIRHSNSSYGKKLTAEQIAQMGNTLTMTVRLNPLCDNYDRIGNVNLALVPKDSETYVYNQVQRVEIGRFITPFMDKNDQPDEVPYVFEVNNLADILHNESISAEFDFWVELEVYGYQGGPGQGGAAVEIPGCAGRNDVYMGSLEFTTETIEEPVQPENFIFPLSYKYELKDYTLDGTDILGETTRTIDFTLENAVENVTLYIITSNHGSNQNGEEYIRRNHFIYFDNDQVLMYKPGGLSCEPFRQYNTQGNGIYGPTPRTPAQWASFNNWCPGDKIPTRTVVLGDLEAGLHTFKIDVPDAVFAGDQGYFPMSVYIQGEGEPGEINLNTKDILDNVVFISPNPVTNIATINTVNDVRNVNIYNTLGQQVLSTKTKQVDFGALNSGVYMMHITFSDNKTVMHKIIKN